MPDIVVMPSTEASTRAVVRCVSASTRSRHPGLTGLEKRSVGVLQHVISWLARDSPSWHDDLWLVDSTPVESGRSRQTAQRSDLGGWAEYGYCASRSRYFVGAGSPHGCHTVGAADSVRAGTG